ncbi:MAG: NERD domain-containing protein [Methanobacteriaceae archaeon]|jgi:hypothetical protein|nr:NERD domain-containing protein [Methanobacteriaceae archaeon]
MKVVTCKNCGANYQLDDDDDISTFECSSCAGNLELVERYPSPPNSKKSKLFRQPYDENDLIVKCRDCGLKYRLNNEKNISDYECDSCGGLLKYIDKSLNEEFEKNNDKKKNTFNKTSEQIKTPYIKEKHENTNIVKTARTRIPSYILSKFERDFDISKVTNYNTLKDYLKKNFYEEIEKDYTISRDIENSEDITEQGFFNRISSKKAEEDIKTDKHDLIPYPNEKNNQYHYVYLVIGAICGIIGFIDVFTSNRGYGIIFLFIGLIITIYGIYKTKDYGETEKRGKIIRERLLSLPEEFYVLYYVKVPESHSAINHIVIGPTGIYSIITQKYYSKESDILKSEKETNEFIKSTEENTSDISISENKFHYNVKKDKFEHNNKIKQKSLKLGENLINFLNENGFEHFFVEPLVGFVNNDVAVINMPLTDEDLFLDELINKIKTNPVTLDTVTIHKCAVILSQYATECSS